MSETYTYSIPKADYASLVDGFLNKKCQNLRFQIINNYQDFQQRRDEWNALVEQSLNDYVFLRHEWFDVWWNNFGNGSQLFVVMVYVDEQLVAIAPLMIGKWRLRFVSVRCLKFMENDESPRCEFIFHPKYFFVLSRLLNFISRHSRSWDLVLFRNISSFSPTFIALKHFLSKRKFAHGFQDALVSPFIQFNGNWDDFLGTLSKRFRRSIRQFRRKAFANGNVTYEEINVSPANAVLLMNTLSSIGSHSWKNPINSDIGSGQNRRKFFAELSRISSFHGWLKIWILRVDNKPVAFHYILNYNNISYLLRSEFDENYRDLSPGSTLQTIVIENFFRNQGQEFDFCGGDDAYKKHWTKENRHHKTVFIFSDYIKSQLLYLMEFQLLTRLKKIRDHKKTQHQLLRISNVVGGNFAVFQKLRNLSE
ncbi:MAG: GNAT family N-acetyltransferase [Calditrichaeota bacterium]|nr:GNAT family N-acetyltransferase [Calditrichota bacterium]